MPVIKGNGLPDDHPFKGTHIIFGVKRTKPVENSLPKGNPPFSPEDQNISDEKDRKQAQGGNDGEI